MSALSAINLLFPVGGALPYMSTINPVLAIVLAFFIPFEARNSLIALLVSYSLKANSGFS